MDTYGDMVTLLLCFFVLLYSISTVDAMKWELVVKSFNPKAEEVSQIVMETEMNEEGMEVPGGTDVPLDEIEDFEDLYYMLQEAIAENNLEGEVELEKGEGYTFINFVIISSLMGIVLFFLMKASIFWMPLTEH